MHKKCRNQLLKSYNLHDKVVCSMKLTNSNLHLVFLNDIKKSTPFFSELIIKNIDFNFSDIYILSKNGKYGKFRGKKEPLKKFLNKYKTFSFEIIDELYGYNKLIYSGYINFPTKNKLKEFELSIYFEGDILCK